MSNIEHSYEFINNNEDLQEFCLEIIHDEAITIDTEFLINNKYYADLCLIQIAGFKVRAIIDPLMITDMSPLIDIFRNPSIVKVFHACTHDIKLIWHKYNTIPKPLFDTQIAASFCGFGENVSYHKLVKKICGYDLDKSSRFTNWNMRPLTFDQLDYAIKDVTFLREIYAELTKKLTENKRLNWVKEETKQLEQQNIYENNTSEIWKKIKIKQATPKMLGAIKELAKWREELAQKKNTFRKYIVSDDNLVLLARHAPLKDSDFNTMVPELQRITNRYRKDIIKAIKIGQTHEHDKKHFENIKQIKKTENKPITKLLMVLLSQISEESKISNNMIATKNEIISYCNQRSDTKVRFLDGWRYEIFGKYSMAFVKGDFVIKVMSNGKLTFYKENELNHNELEYNKTNLSELNHNELEYNETNLNELNHNELEYNKTNLSELNHNELEYNETNLNELNHNELEYNETNLN